MDKNDIQDIKEYMCQILKMKEQTQQKFETALSLNDINDKLDKLFEQQTTDQSANQLSENLRLSSHQSTCFAKPSSLTVTNPTATKNTSNNETFTIGTYNGFDIMIRDQDGYINATKIVCKQSTMIAKRITLNGQLKPPLVNALKQSDFNSFIDPQEQYFELINSTNSNSICFNNVDTDLAIAYRCIDLMRIYEPTGNNFITSIEPLQGADQSYSINISLFNDMQVEIFNQTMISALESIGINRHELFKQIFNFTIKYACERDICHK
ncbi:MAG: hypothetical protein EZS28_025258 [Streblomastix strix]|uniref:Uncharacterized protein n=1 Tax=Streblomastix strix TaxID=222440 RepID=A0A5J4V9M4_9EUKA|nr:MAG: hypothetical protein EZS28_025258 [Streblomastix strix]